MGGFLLGFLDLLRPSSGRSQGPSKGVSPRFCQTVLKTDTFAFRIRIKRKPLHFQKFWKSLDLLRLPQDGPRAPLKRSTLGFAKICSTWTLLIIEFESNGAPCIFRNSGFVHALLRTAPILVSFVRSILGCQMVSNGISSPDSQVRIAC